MDERIQFTVALVMTMVCFKHVLYDFVVLVMPAAAAVMAPKSKARAVVLWGLGILWFLSSVLKRFFPERVYASEVMVFAVVLVAMAVATSRLFVVDAVEA